MTFDLTCPPPSFGPPLLPGSDYPTGRDRNEAVKEGHNNTMGMNYECSSADDAHTDWGAAGYLKRLWPHWLRFQDTPKNSTRHTEVQEFDGGRRGFSSVTHWTYTRLFYFPQKKCMQRRAATLYGQIFRDLRGWIQCYLTLFVWYYFYVEMTQVKHVQQKDNYMHHTCVSTFMQCVHGKFHF